MTSGSRSPQLRALEGNTKLFEKAGKNIQVKRASVWHSWCYIFESIFNHDPSWIAQLSRYNEDDIDALLTDHIIRGLVPDLNTQFGRKLVVNRWCSFEDKLLAQPRNSKLLACVTLQNSACPENVVGARSRSSQREVAGQLVVSSWRKLTRQLPEGCHWLTGNNWDPSGHYRLVRAKRWLHSTNSPSFPLPYLVNDNPSQQVTKLQHCENTGAQKQPYLSSNVTCVKRDKYEMYYYCASSEERTTRNSELDTV